MYNITVTCVYKQQFVSKITSTSFKLCQTLERLRIKVYSLI